MAKRARSRRRKALDENKVLTWIVGPITVLMLVAAICYGINAYYHPKTLLQPYAAPATPSVEKPEKDPD